MSEPDLVKTGIAGLDAILPNGIPGAMSSSLRARLAGETTMGVEFVYRGARETMSLGMLGIFEGRSVLNRVGLDRRNCKHPL